MNTENSITLEQIAEVFRAYALAENPSITRITSGFTNEVYEVDGYILKVCVNLLNEPNFEREVFLYQMLRGTVLTPEPIVVDISKSLLSKFYMIYPKIEGESAGQRWHGLDNMARREFVRDLCQQLQRMDNFPLKSYTERFGLNLNLIWQEEVVNGLFRSLAKVQEQEIPILPETTVQAIDTYIQKTAYVLEPQKLGLVFWDVQWDNMLIDNQNRLAALIDFEGISIVSIDYRLSIIRAMMERPHIFLSSELEPCANTEDYKHLMEWYREFYPELFDFPELEKRVSLYELGDVLDHLPDWPKARQLHERLEKILSTY
ncbi:MAG: aminoglycoside phosphotransferase family protein [Armatimonas sp.]